VSEKRTPHNQLITKNKEMTSNLINSNAKLTLTNELSKNESAYQQNHVGIY